MVGDHVDKIYEIANFWRTSPKEVFGLTVDEFIEHCAQMNRIQSVIYSSR